MVKGLENPTTATFIRPSQPADSMNSEANSVQGIFASITTGFSKAAPEHRKWADDPSIYLSATLPTVLIAVYKSTADPEILKYLRPHVEALKDPRLCRRLTGQDAHVLNLAAEDLRLFLEPKAFPSTDFLRRKNKEGADKVLLTRKGFSSEKQASLNGQRKNLTGSGVAKRTRIKLNMPKRTSIVKLKMPPQVNDKISRALEDDIVKALDEVTIG